MGAMKREFEEAREAITEEFGAWLYEEQCIMYEDDYFDVAGYYVQDVYFEDEENLDY